jgi:hypothetical protein
VCVLLQTAISPQFCRCPTFASSHGRGFCQAAFERGEAEKLLKIKASEADAEAKRLAGVGMANMRAAMAQGFQDVVGCGGRWWVVVGGGKMMENGKVYRCFVVMYSWENVGK